MPRRIDGETYYLTGEVVEQADISRSTLERWTKSGRVPDAALRDRNNWRLFTPEELQAIVAEAHRVRGLST